jgi:subtilisin family serine protease
MLKRIWVVLSLFIVLLGTFAVAYAAPAGQVILGDELPAGIPTHIIMFKSAAVGGMSAQAVESTANSLAALHGLTATNVYSSAFKGMAAVVPAGRLAALRRDPRIASIEPNQVWSITAQTVPTGIGRIFATSNPNLTINGVDDLRIDVDVAVIDTGVDFDHPDLNVYRRVNCTGFSPFQKRCTSGGDDGNGHGTHVAGTIGALDNNIGVVGVAPGARIWAVKVLSNSGSGYTNWIIAGIDYVTANASSIEVANMSLGCECTSSAQATAISNSIAAGVVYAVAAGNSDKDASTFSPANHPDVITVSALADFNGLPGGGAAPTCRVDQDDTLADFSNFGSLIEIAAPGVCIYSTWMGGGYNTISGTSMASPHAAGAAALLASVNNPNNRTDVLNIRSTLMTYGNLNWTDDSGDGIQEKLLDVSNTTIFNPRTVAGSQ